ncbi:MAG: methanogenesis marker protein Mmp4/MtxX [Promethearchaeota archaeon]
MKISERFEKLALGKSATIGIGLGNDDVHNQKILDATIIFLKKFNVNIVLFGTDISTAHIRSSIEGDSEIYQRIKYITTNQPEEKIIEYLLENKINAVIRGSLSSSAFLKRVKIEFKISEINRLTLVETFGKYQFFYGPVGIDECNTLERKKQFIEKALIMFQRLKIPPRISILSGGRKGDVGRDERVDQTIEMAMKLEKYYNETKPELEIFHDEILIEQAIEKQANLIIAPDGISGNLIYRTLVHLGGGNAYGAIYMDLDKVIIDTSRVGQSSEILGALLLALAIC